ncbi:hypothetical protein WJX74_002926 [Apatococcus lobatus]|uniref:C3HC-type domain-containing protein n=1 Tax=Apatococcus lobatus TaxID=904363 RepID=A0AAW1RKG8_9CHLO
MFLSNAFAERSPAINRHKLLYRPTPASCTLTAPRAVTSDFEPVAQGAGDMTSQKVSMSEKLKQSLERFVKAGPQVAGDEDPALIASLFPSKERRNADHGIRPFQREDLYRRLHTYKVGTWFCKPEVAGPLACALRGWINTGVDLISCEVCRAKLSLPIPSLLSHDDIQKLAEAFAAKLMSAHAETCIWRTTSTSERRRLHLLMTPGFKLGPPVPNLRPAISQDDSPAKPANLTTIMTEPLPNSGEGLTGLSREQKQRLLGLFGWNVRDPPQGSRSQPLLFCTMCGVKSGLWSFKPDETDPIPGWQPGNPLSGRARQAGSSPGFGLFTIAGGNLQTGSRSAGTKRPFGSGSYSAFGSSRAENGQGGSPPIGLGGAQQAPAPSTIAGGTIAPISDPSSGLHGQSIANGTTGTPAEDGQASPKQTPAPKSAAEIASASPAAQPFGLRSTPSAVPAFGLAALRSSSSLAAASPEVQQGSTAAAASDGPPSDDTAPHRGERGDESASKRQRISSSWTEGPGDGPVSTARSGTPAGHFQPEAVASWLQGQEILDPLKLHRPFCPWVNGSGASSGKEGGRVGWQYCLQQLVQLPADQEEDGHHHPHHEESGFQSHAQQRLVAQVRKIQAA